MQLLTHSLNGETFTTKLTKNSQGRNLNSQDWLLVFTSPSGQQTLAAWTTRSSPYDVTVPIWGALHLTSTPFYVNPSTVPEPGAFVLLATGLAGLLAYAWRRRR
jgi:PEP-CTERM motif